MIMMMIMIMIIIIKCYFKTIDTSYLFGLTYFKKQCTDYRGLVCLYIYIYIYIYNFTIQTFIVLTKSAYMHADR